MTMNRVKEDQDDDLDLDHLLDDALDEFKKPVSIPVKKQNVTMKSDHGDASVKVDSLEEEFLRQLTSGMEELFQSVQQKGKDVKDDSLCSHDQGAKDDQGKVDIENESVLTNPSVDDMEAMKQTMADLLKAMDLSDVPGLDDLKSKIPTASSGNATTASEAMSTDKLPKMSFEEAISSTMHKMQESSQQADNNLNDALRGNPMSFDDESMSKMMKELETLMDSNEFNDVFENMVGQLMSKDILYEPMKDLAIKYPEYLEKNQDKLTEEDVRRYTDQLEIIQEIVKIYENSDKEPNDQDGQRVIDLMQKMQESGNPPEEIMKEMGSGLDFLNDKSNVNGKEECPMM